MTILAAPCMAYVVIVCGGGACLCRQYLVSLFTVLLFMIKLLTILLCLICSPKAAGAALQWPVRYLWQLVVGSRPCGKALGAPAWCHSVWRELRLQG
jgi:hypothetical protein